MRFPSVRPKRLALRIQGALALTLLVVGVATGVLLYTLHRNELLAGLKAATTTQGALLEQGLRHAMLDRDPHLLAALIQRLGREPDVAGVLVLSKGGEVRFASDSLLVGSRFSPSDPTCLACHQQPVRERGHTLLFRHADGRRVLRNVNPIANGPQCFGCHNPTDRVNGVLVIDHALDRVESQLRAEAAFLAGGTLAVIGLVGVILGWLLHRLVLRPVALLRRALSAAEGGDLGRELPATGDDEMADLSAQFNRMAASLRETLARLREREEYLGRILASADDGIVVVDRDLRVVTANDAYLALCGKQRDEVVGQACCFAPQCHRPETDHCPSWAAFSQGAGRRVVRRMTDDAGATRTYEISASPLEINGEICQALEVWRDITERTRLEAGLAHSERLASVGLLAAGISHEINNPLATITTCLDGLQRRLDETPTQQAALATVIRDYLELIQREVHRCRDLTSKLVLLSRKSSLAREPVDLNAILAETISLLDFEVADRRAQIDRELAPDLPLVRGDDARLRQVMLNLLMNALQAVGEGGRVCIRSQHEGDRVRIAIIDNGCGIAPADLDHVFEPFYSARRGRRSSGLGLFISNQIVHAHGGTMEIRSQLGLGTEVEVVIPVDGGSGDEGPDLRSPG